MGIERYEFSFEIFCSKEDSDILMKKLKEDILNTKTSWRFRSLRNLKKRIV